MQRSRWAVATGVTGVLLLVGCTGEPGPAPSPSLPAPEPTGVSGTSPAPSPEPTADPSATDPDASATRPALEDLVISPGALGPLTVGSGDPADNEGAEMLTWVEDACADVDPGAGDADEEDGDGQVGGGTGQWVAQYGADLNYMGETVEPPFFVQADVEGVHRIDVMGQTPATEEGIGIGSTLDELRKAYPDLEGPFDGPVSRVWWVTEDTGSLVFETQDDSDGLRPAGTEESVILIRVLAPGWAPDFATANSGDVAGACF